MKCLLPRFALAGLPLPFTHARGAAPSTYGENHTTNHGGMRARLTFDDANHSPTSSRPR